MKKHNMPEDEEDISDDPYLNEIISDLESIDKKTDNKPVIVLVTIAFLYAIFDEIEITNKWIDIVFLSQ